MITYSYFYYNFLHMLILIHLFVSVVTCSLIYYSTLVPNCVLCHLGRPLCHFVCILNTYTTSRWLLLRNILAQATISLFSLPTSLRLPIPSAKNGTYLGLTWEELGTYRLCFFQHLHPEHIPNASRTHREGIEKSRTPIVSL